MRAKRLLKEYEVVVRKLPSGKKTQTPLYKMRIFAPDNIVAKFRFWYFFLQLKKFKKTTEIVSLKQVYETSPIKMKNFGIWLRYDSRSGIHNMYREYRDLTVVGAVTQCYRDMGARHRARALSIQIINSTAAAQTRRVMSSSSTTLRSLQGQQEAVLLQRAKELLPVKKRATPKINQLA
ncbi:hypothetical protein KR044_005877 [Drosophila immigrans]|nr:hypothetical protein KR044_005877 [Drosophila immigrans]